MCQSALETSRLVAEPDPEISVHSELIAGYDQYALLVAEPFHQTGRADWPGIAWIRNCAGAWGNETKRRSVRSKPLLENTEAGVDDAARAGEDPGAHVR